MAVTATSTARELVNAALRKATVLSIADEADAEMAANALAELNRMLKAWQATVGIWTRTEQVVTVTNAATSYALAAPARPLRVFSANLRRAGIDTPLWQMTRREYLDLPLKTSAGRPTSFYYERLREQGNLFVWPVLAVAAGETIRLNVEREIEDVASLNEDIDIPAEWYDAIVYGLAARVGEDYGLGSALLAARADRAMKLAQAFEMDETVYLGGER